MKIYIEVLVILILFIIFILWRLWLPLSKYLLLKKYDPEKDKGKLAEDKRTKDGKTKEGGADTKLGREKSITGIASERIDGLEQPEGRELLPTTSSNTDGKTSNSDRKNGFGIRKLLRRR